jgi:hypothetical protein
MNQDKPLCKDGTLAHHWILDEHGNAYCKKCFAKKKFQSSTLRDMNDKLHKDTKGNPFMGVSW